MTQAMPLPDLSSALRSFQQALTDGFIQLQPGSLDQKLFVHLDRPNGQTRLTYVRIEGTTVTALVQFMPIEPYKGEPCFSVGWAVPESHRGEGRSGEAFLAAANELRHGMARNGVDGFWLEGVVGEDNPASQRMAEKVISPPMDRQLDSEAGVPVIQYVRRIDANTAL